MSISVDFAKRAGMRRIYRTYRAERSRESAWEDFTKQHLGECDRDREMENIIAPVSSSRSKPRSRMLKFLHLPHLALS